MGLVSNEEFLARLGTAVAAAAAADKGTVFMTIKRFNDPKKNKKSNKKRDASGAAMDVDVTTTQPPPAPAPPSVGPVEHACLLRFQHGNAKVSTLLHPDDTDAFMSQYAAVAKRHAGVMFAAPKQQPAK
ncbi:hypothetical protein BC828DRAFT_372946 [Blastocladiella britannica]|nr:hypothetical protein BC828DRAFT_372946 [Blastocladiella britannica]